MAYQFNLGSGQQIVVQQQGEQTAIGLSSHGAGQQQQQQSTVTTGQWQEPPMLFQTGGGFVLRLVGSQGTTVVQIEASGLQLLSSAAVPNLADAAAVPGQEVADAAGLQVGQARFDMEPMQPMKPMPPMEPMKPMQMGNMSMQMNPMRMQMGDMKLEMGSESSSQSSPSMSSPSREQPQSQRFCTQCGQPVAASDRFCAQCGHQLSA